MNKTFKTFPNRLDTTLVAFRADDNAALLAEICCNSTTVHVREGFNCVLVPAFAADAASAHLIKYGWVEA